MHNVKLITNLVQDGSNYNDNNILYFKQVCLTNKDEEQNNLPCEKAMKITIKMYCHRPQQDNKAASSVVCLV